MQCNVRIRGKVSLSRYINYTSADYTRQQKPDSFAQNKNDKILFIKEMANGNFGDIDRETTLIYL